MFKGLGLEKDALKVKNLLKWTIGGGAALTGAGLLAKKMMKAKGPGAPGTSGSTVGDTRAPIGDLGKPDEGLK